MQTIILCNIIYKYVYVCVCVYTHLLKKLFLFDKYLKLPGGLGPSSPHIVGAAVLCATFLLSSIFYVRRNYWHRENFRLLIFNEFTRFGISRTRFNHFYKMSTICMHHSKILWTLYLKNLRMEIDETLYSVAPLYN